MCDIDMALPCHNLTNINNFNAPSLNLPSLPTCTDGSEQDPSQDASMNWTRVFQKYLTNLSGPNLPPLTLPNPSSSIANQNSLLSIATLTNVCSAELSKQMTGYSGSNMNNLSSMETNYNFASNGLGSIDYSQLRFDRQQPYSSCPAPTSNHQQFNANEHKMIGRKSPTESHSVSNNQDSLSLSFDSKSTFACYWDQCQEVFSTRTGLATHCSSHLAKYIPVSPSPSTVQVGKKQKVVMHCKWNDCKEIFYSLKDLAKHMAEETHIGQTPFLAKEHEEENTDKTKKKKRYACSFPTCGRLFADSSNRKKHERTHDLNRERFYCSEKGCTKSYSTKTDLNIHMKAHKGEFPHKCTYPNCSKVFVRLSELYAHERSHDNILPHLCTVCGKRFREKARLKMHEEGHSISSTDSN